MLVGVAVNVGTPPKVADAVAVRGVEVADKDCAEDEVDVSERVEVDVAVTDRVALDERVAVLVGGALADRVALPSLTCD